VVSKLELFLYNESMKITLIAAVTADWFIAPTVDHKVDWTSKADKDNFQAITKKIGVVIMGSNTFETIGHGLSERRVIVMSRTKTYPNIPGVETSSETPRALVLRLKKEGVKELAIAGGATIYGAFMKSGLVDKIAITIEPVIFGGGIPLMKKPVTKEFDLKNTTPLAGGAVVLEYEVK
jgi:dihydrofolate reductase